MFKWRGGSLGILGNKLSKRMPENEKDKRCVREKDIDDLISSKKKNTYSYKPLSSSERKKREVRVIKEPFGLEDNNSKLFLDIDPNFSKLCRLTKILDEQNVDDKKENQILLVPPSKYIINYTVIFDKNQNYFNEETQTE